MNNSYDFIVIGAGISACTFASFLNKRFSDASILLVEHGRRIGGRATTRKSRGLSSFAFVPLLAVTSLPWAKLYASTGVVVAPKSPASKENPVCT